MLDYRKPLIMSPVSNFSILFFSIFFFLSVHIAFGDGNDDQEEAVRLELLHRHHPQVSEKLHGEAKLQGANERVKDIHDHDHNRHRFISESLNRTQTEKKLMAEGQMTTEPSSSATPIGMKMISGADYGASEYFVELKVGTPPQKCMLIADTGSDLTWVKCRYRRCMGNCSANPAHMIRNEKKERFPRAFHANRSSSFQPISCGKKCMDDYATLFALPDCKTPTSPCRYDYGYSGGSSARGIFAIETLTVALTNGKEKQLHDTLIGCTESATGRVFNGADGVLGLGTTVFSFPYRARQNANGGGFSYCLVDHLSNNSATSYFVLGPPAVASRAATSLPSGNMTFTELFIGEFFSSYYGVGLIGISADGVMLNIPPRVWDITDGGGTIVDSGTSLTMLAAPAFDMVMQALTPKLKRFPKLQMEPFTFCFNNSEYLYEMTPQLRFHFSDGAVFEPPVKSYIITVSEWTMCVAVVSLAFPATNIIGNILQQNHLWQFDFFKRRIGFAPSDCAA